MIYAVELCIDSRGPALVLEVTPQRIRLFKEQWKSFPWGRNFNASTTARPALPLLPLCVAVVQANASGQTPGQ